MVGSRLKGTGIVLLVLTLGTADGRVFGQPTQPIYLQYDGFVKNPDGTRTVSFGYFNQNNVDVTIAPGDANSFVPAPADRNQPVTFRKGRHRFACSMIVDKAFDGRLQWTVRFAGKTITTTAKTLDPLYELELNSQKRAIAGLDTAGAPKNVCVNRAPSVTIANPFGETHADTDATSAAAISGRVDQEVPVFGVIDDDGLPRGGRLVIAWKKTSGPGDVTFSDAAVAGPRIKFTAPGKYELEVSATDGEKTTTIKVVATIS